MASRQAWYYGYAYCRWDMNAVVIAVIPLNKIIQYGRAVYFWFKCAEVASWEQDYRDMMNDGRLRHLLHDVHRVRRKENEI